MGVISNLSLPRWPEEDAPLALPPGFHPDGVLGGLNLDGPVFDRDAWANGTHILSPTVPSVPMRDKPHREVPKDRAKGLSDALNATETIVDGVHGAVEQSFKLFTGSLPGDKTVLKALPWATRAITAPLAIGAGIADTVSDINNDAPRGEAILGNTLRTVLVYGSGLVANAVAGPLAGPTASYYMDKKLPSGAVIGHSVIEGLSDPQRARAALMAVP